MYDFNQKEEGITLIALVTTIVVLLILASITIGAVTGEGGLIGNANEAKERTEIANEKEVVDRAVVQAMGNNKRGNLVKNELQEELDKITGEGETEVTTDVTDYGFFVKFLASKRIYKVSRDGEVEYLGKEEELLTQANIIANPESNPTAELVQSVELTVETPIEIEGADFTLVSAWSQDKENAPADSEFKVATLEGEGRRRTTTVESSATDEGDYYLWVRVVVGEIEKEECFGPYAIKDHTTLVSVPYADSQSTSGFLGSAYEEKEIVKEIQRGLIKSIRIENKIGTHSVNDENTWDVTADKNGKYLAWVEKVENDEKEYYEITIAGEGGVVANSYSTYLFKNIGYGVENEEVTIEGLEYLDTGLVTDMGSMFENCKANSLDLSKFNTSKVTSMSSMFYACKAKTINVSNFDTSNVTTMYCMFRDCSVTNLDLSNFNTSNVTNMSNMFDNCSVLNLDLNKFNTSKVTTMMSMFRNCSVTNLDLSNFDTSKVTTMQEMFNNCKATNINVSSFDTSNVTNMRQMFTSCSVTSLDLSNFNTSKVTNMYRMFAWCAATTINVSSFDTSNVTDMSGMFRECGNLTKLDLSNFNTQKVTTMDWMFGGSQKIEEIIFSNFEAKDNLNMNNMFYYCQNLKRLDIRNLDMTNVSNYQNCFYTVPTTCNIIVNETMKQWFTDNYPSYTNVTIAN